MRLVDLARLGLPLVALGCGGNDAFPTQSAANACVPSAGSTPWTIDDATALGAYAVGTLTPTFVDDTRATPANGTYAGDAVRTLVTGVWYPAASAGAGSVAASGGPFPIVMYSHGFTTNQNENVALFELLASNGYVVVSTRFPLTNGQAPGGPTELDLPNQPADVSFVLDQVIALGATAGHPLQGAVDGSRVGAVGFSVGALTTLLATFHKDLRDPRIDAAVVLGPPASMFAPSFYDTTDTPLLALHGDADAVFAYDPHATTLRANARSPMALLTLARGTHTGFTTAGLIFEGQPGYEHVDVLSCGTLATFGYTAPLAIDYAALLGGAAAGVFDPTSVDAFCPAALGVGMLPSRQQQIETAAVRSFLDAYLSADAALARRACHFNERVLPAEADVSLAVR